MFAHARRFATHRCATPAFFARVCAVFSVLFLSQTVLSQPVSADTPPTAASANTTSKPTAKTTSKPSAKTTSQPSHRMASEPLAKTTPTVSKKPATVAEKKSAEEDRRSGRLAQSNPPTDKKLRESSEEILVPQIDVIGRRRSALDSVPGSGTVITPQEIQNRGPAHIEEMLRTTPGINVTSEEGQGLRLNIGIRGLDPNRSRRVLLLEDGVPLSMGVYGEPEAYYTPMIERVERIEILKGSGSILWGPQTVGGVVNFITREPPKRLTIGARAAYGSYNYFLAQAFAGDTVGAFGYLFEAAHKRFDGHRNLGLAQTDVSAKFRIQISPRSVFGIKLHFYDESSRSTYLGLTTPQYENNAAASPAIHDRFLVRRYAISATHKHFFETAGSLQTTFYAYQIERDWMRQDFDRENKGANYERIVDGNNQVVASSDSKDGSTLYFRRSTGNRDRLFHNAGLETRYVVNFSFGNVVDNELSAGVRLHVEAANEQHINGERENSPSGDVRDDERRWAFASALFLQNKFMFLDKRLQITPGVRVEMLRNERHILRTRVKDANGKDVPTDVDRLANSFTATPIPGLGISYQPINGLSIFGGVHRGYAPPRIKDAITAGGSSIEIDAEFSWNYELGLRSRIKRFFQAELTGFLMDFQNQVIPPAEASGAVASDPANQGKPFVNAGRTLHAGLEASAMFDLADAMRWGFRLPLTLTYTWVPLAIFAEPGTKYYNNRLPYAPEHLVSANLGFFHPIGFSASVTAHYMSEQFADNAMTVQASADGLVGRIEGRFLLDARIAYTYQMSHWSVGVFFEGKNLTDARYIASRRPQGIMPGMFRQFIGGIHGNY